MSTDDESSRLKREIAILEEERDVLLEVSEDFQILSNLSEKVNSLGTEQKIIGEILESTSILKDLPSVMFMKKEGETFKVTQELRHLNVSSRLNEEFSEKDFPILQKVPKNGMLLKMGQGTPSKALGFLPKSPKGLEIRSCFILPMYIRHGVHGIFVFCTFEKGVKAFEKSKDLFNRLVLIAASRIENIYLVLTIEILNKKLTERFRERGKRLTESEEKFRNLAEQSPNMIFINKSGRVVYANKRCEEIMGYSREEFYSGDFNLMKIIAPESRDLIKENLKKHQKGEEIPPYEYKLITKDGRELIGIHTTKLIDYEDEKAILGIVTDITERKKAEEQIRYLKEFQENIIDESPVVMEVVNRDLVVTSWNRAAEEYTQVKKEDILGKKFFEVIPSLKKLGWDKIFRRVIKTGEPYNVKDYKITRTFGPHKGETWYQDVNVVPLKEGSKISGAIVTINDITERKKAENALRESEEKYRSLMESSHDLIFIVDRKTGRILEINDAVSKTLGYSMDEIIGTVSGDRVVPRHREAYKREFERLMKTRVYSGEFDIRRKDGGIVSVSVSGAAFGDYLYAIGHNITEKKVDEEKLEALLNISQQITTTLDLESLLEIATKNISESTDVDMISIMLHDKGKWVVRAAYSRIEKKPTFAATELNLLDFPKMNEAVRKKKTVYVEDLQDPKTQTQIEIAVAKKLKIGSGVHVPLIARGKVIGLLNFAAVGMARKFTKKDIEYFETIANELSAMVANAGLYEGLKNFSKTLEEKVTERTAELQKARDSLQKMVEDVTRSNKALEEANLKLVEADRLKSVFLASVSHELRTPLNSIIGFTGVLLQGLAGELNREQMKQLEIVNSNAKHLLSLIEGLLDISKIEADRVEVSAEKFHLEEVINEVVNTFLPEIERKGLKLKKVVENLEMYTDRRLFKQVLLNLLNNAVKFTKKGTIEIDALAVMDLVEVTVKDTGRGIKKKDLPAIFEPFSRIRSTSEVADDGTGLGLYISKKITTLLGGELEAKSRYNVGSEFSIKLPRRHKAP